MFFAALWARLLSSAAVETNQGDHRARAVALEVLDLMLPGLDGIEVCRTIKMDAVTRQIPIIIVSAKGEETDIVLGPRPHHDDPRRRLPLP